jgi:hypothetical protein
MKKSFINQNPSKKNDMSIIYGDGLKLSAAILGCGGAPRCNNYQRWIKLVPLRLVAYMEEYVGALSEIKPSHYDLVKVSTKSSLNQEQYCV